MSDQMIRVDLCVAHQALALEASNKAQAIESEGDYEEAGRLKELSKSEWQKARDICLELVADYDKNMDGWMYLGANHFQLGEYQEAIKAFERYLNIRIGADYIQRHLQVIEDTYGAIAQAWNNMGLCYAKLNNMADAVMAVWMAVQTEPDNPQFSGNLQVLFNKIVEEMAKGGIV